MPPERLDLGVFELGEGPVWDPKTGVLSWVDITPGRLHTYDPARGMHTTFDCGQPLGAAIPRQGGGYVCAVKEGVALADPGSPPSAWLARGWVPPTHRLNDAACDPAGRLWVGSTALEFGSRPGALHRVEPDGSVRTMLEPVQFANGIAFSPDASALYLIDSLAHVLLAFDFDNDAGTLSEARRVLVFDPAEGLADGLAVDAHGGLWVARYGASTVERYEPSGELTERIVLPALQPTCPGFATNGTNHLYVTTAWQFMEADARDEDQGALFRLEPGVGGAPTYAFGV